MRHFRSFEFSRLFKSFSKLDVRMKSRSITFDAENLEVSSQKSNFTRGGFIPRTFTFCHYDPIGFLHRTQMPYVHNMATVKRRKLEHEQSSGSDSPSFASFSSESEESASEDERKPNSEEKDGAEVPTTQTSNGNAIDKVNKQTNRATEEAEPRDEDTSAAPMKTFQDLGIIDPLCQACTALGFRNPTPIQVESIPWALQDRDLIGLAETGSGKTAAFALPILQALLEKPQSKFALVLAPTRELAIQTSQQFSALGSLIAVKTAVIVGGMQEVEQAIALAKEPHIVVATPGRLLYHLENTKGFHLKKLRYRASHFQLKSISLQKETLYLPGQHSGPRRSRPPPRHELWQRD